MIRSIILIAIIFLPFSADVQASLAAEPHSDEHLRQYAQNPAFDGSVSLGNCSASRVQIDGDDSMDFYLTAAHCLSEKAVFHYKVEGAIISALEEIIRLESMTPLEKIITRAIFERHLASFTDKDVIEAELISKSKAELIINCEKVLKKMGSAQAFLAEINPTGPSNVNIKDIVFVKHPDTSKDVALFTTCKKTNYPRYTLYRGSPKNAVGKTVTNVAFGLSLLNQPTPKPERQAFDTAIHYRGNRNVLVSVPFKPDLNRTLEHPPIGVITQGDSGGSLLIKENDDYQLVGIVNGTLNGEVHLSYYEKVPPYLKSNSHNQRCFQQLKADGTQGHCCYGTRSIWAEIDFNFIANAKKSLLKTAAQIPGHQKYY